jgi:hypothetical protein
MKKILNLIVAVGALFFAVACQTEHYPPSLVGSYYTGKKLKPIKDPSEVNLIEHTGNIDGDFEKLRKLGNIAIGGASFNGAFQDVPTVKAFACSIGADIVLCGVERPKGANQSVSYSFDTGQGNRRQVYLFYASPTATLNNWSAFCARMNNGWGLKESRTSEKNMAAIYAQVWGVPLPKNLQTNPPYPKWPEKELTKLRERLYEKRREW